MNNQEQAGGETVWKVLSHRQQNLEDCDFWWEVTDGKTSLLSHMDDEQTMQDIANALNDTGASIYIDKSDEAAACHVAGYLEGENKRLSQHLTTLQGEVEKLRNALEELVEWFPELINEWRWKAGTVPKNQRDYDAVTAALDKANQALNPTPHER